MHLSLKDKQLTEQTGCHWGEEEGAPGRDSNTCKSREVQKCVCKDSQAGALQLYSDASSCGPILHLIRLQPLQNTGPQAPPGGNLGY